MRILWLNAGLLVPLDKGGKLRTWHLMRRLAARHEVTYLGFCDREPTAAERAGMSLVCRRLETVTRTDVRKGTARFYLDVARHLVDPLPYAVAKYRSAGYAARLRRLLDEAPFDLVVCDFLPPLVNMPASLPCPAVLFTHNVEAEIWRRHAENASAPLERRLLRQQWQRMLRFEGRALERFALVLAVSEADRATLARLYGAHLRSDVQVVATGVDASFFAPDRAARPDARHLVFTGSMDWLPNEDAMVYFCREILPRIRDEEPAATLSIVGRTPTPAVQQLANRVSGVIVTGRVDDVRPHVAAAGVYVVPLRIGGGTRLKIFEAMAMEKAVVSTTVGAEGLPVTDGRDIVLADDPASFASSVVRLMRDESRRQAIERAARALVVERYDWPAVAGELESALVAAAAGTGLRPRTRCDAAGAGTGAGLKPRTTSDRVA